MPIGIVKGRLQALNCSALSKVTPRHTSGNWAVCFTANGVYTLNIAFYAALDSNLKFGALNLVTQQFCAMTAQFFYTQPPSHQNHSILYSNTHDLTECMETWIMELLDYEGESISNHSTAIVLARPVRHISLDRWKVEAAADIRCDMSLESLAFCCS